MDKSLFDGANGALTGARSVPLAASPVTTRGRAAIDDNPGQDTERRGTVTRLLQEAGSEESQWAEELLPLIYEELRQLARARMAKEGAGQTIQATALVHEAYLRLIGDADPGWKGRGHFFGAAAQAMRRILIEQARRKRRLKHGGGWERVELDDACAAIDPPSDDLFTVDEAVQKLEHHDPRKGTIFNLRYFAGFTAQETAEALGVSVGTIEREWRFIKAWLREEMERTDSEA